MAGGAVAALLAAWLLRDGLPTGAGGPARPGDTSAAHRPVPSARDPAVAPPEGPSPPGDVPAPPRPGPVALVEVLVTGGGGTPVEGATVRARREPFRAATVRWWEEARNRVEGATAEAVTDRSGLAVLGPTEEGEWAFRAEGPGQAGPVVRRTVARGEGTVRVDLVLWPACSLAGRVVDGSGAPVPGAAVEAGDPRHGGARAEAGGDGTYALGGLPPGDVEVRAARPGAVPLAVATLRLPAVTRYDVVLPAPTRLEGRVTEGPGGPPATGATVRAGTFLGTRSRGEAVTDGDGRYVIDTLSPGPVNLVLVDRAGWVAPAPPPGPFGVNLEVRAGETTLHDIVLVRAASLEGRALDADGRPLAEAGVSVVAAGSHHRSVTADAAGSFRAEGLEPGRASAWIQVAPPPLHFQRAPPATLLLVAGETATVELRLEEGGPAAPGPSVAGRVVEDASGEPVAGARIGWSVVQAAVAVSGPDGRFRLDGLASEGGDYAVRRDGFVEGVFPLPPAEARGEAEIVVRLRRSPRVRGSVVDAAGAPLAGALVRVFAVTDLANPSPAGGPLVRFSPDAIVGVDGTYALPLPWDRGGVFRVEVRAPGVSTFASPDTPVERGRAEYVVDVRAEAPLAFAGRVTDGATGAPVVGADVVQGATVLAVTGADGEFRVAGAAPRLTGGMVRATGYVSASFVPPPSGGRVDVALPPERSITGVVRRSDGGDPGPVAIDATGPVQGGGVADGAWFEVRQLPAGTYLLRVRSRERPPRFPPVELAGVEAGGPPVEVTVVAEERAARRIEGVVLGPAGKGVSGIRVEVRSGTEVVSLRSGPGGIFEGVAPSAGPVTVIGNRVVPSSDPYAGGQDFASASLAGVALPATGLVLPLAAGQTVEGVVDGDSPAALPGARVYAASPDGTFREAAVAEGGVFRVRGLPAGEVRLHARSGSGARSAEVLTSAGARDVRLTLR